MEGSRRPNMNAKILCKQLKNATVLCEHVLCLIQPILDDSPKASFLHLLAFRCMSVPSHLGFEVGWKIYGTAISALPW